MAGVFQTPFGPSKKIEGYVKGNFQKRPLAFKQFFGDTGTTWTDTVNYDVQGNKRNLMGQFVQSDIDVYRVQLPNFETKELTFAYSKEYVGSPNYSEISQRMLGEQPQAMTLDSARLAQAVAQNMQDQFTLAYERFENLYELARAKVLITGAFDTTLATPNGEHKKIVWDMGRTKLVNGSTNNAGERTANVNYINTDIVPEVDLTTLWANTGTAVAGGLSWDSLDHSNSDAAVTPTTAVSPVKHLNRMLEVANYRSGTAAIFMADDAYSWFIYDVNTNYKDAANSLYNVLDPSVQLEVMPYVKEIEGLVFRRMWSAGNGINVPIYTYNGKYHDRSTGVKTGYFPSGQVLLVPPADTGAVRYGKINHIKARWAAQQFWVNSWVGEKNGIESFEIHTNFVVYHKDINSVVSWRVCSSAKGI
jgi:hypothetical protein